MKTYLANNYTTFEAFASDIKTDLTENVKLPISAVHSKAGPISIIDLRPSVSDNAADIVITAELQDKTIKAYSFAVLTYKNYLSLADDDKQLLIGYLNVIHDTQVELKAILDEKARLEAEAKKAAEELAKQIEKEEARQQKRLEKLNELRAEDYLRRNLEPSSQYEVLGWIVKHLKSLSAQVPKSMLGWFNSKFGDAENISVVDDSKKTTGGHAMKWNVSFKATFDAEVPSALSSKVNKAGKVINDVPFVWGLIEKYDFQFGKTQDIEKIKANVPSTYIEQFEAGYSA